MKHLLAKIQQWIIQVIDFKLKNVTMGSLRSGNFLIYWEIGMYQEVQIVSKIEMVYEGF